MAPMLNTLRYANALKDAGVPPKQAEVMAEALDDEMTGQLASKADIERLDTKIDHLDEKLSSQIAGLDKRMDGLKATIGVSITLATLVLTAVQVYFGLQEFHGRFPPVTARGWRTRPLHAPALDTRAGSGLLARP